MQRLLPVALLLITFFMLTSTTAYASNSVETSPDVPGLSAGNRQDGIAVVCDSLEELLKGLIHRDIPGLSLPAFGGSLCPHQPYLLRREVYVGPTNSQGLTESRTCVEE